MISAVISC